MYYSIIIEGNLIPDLLIKSAMIPFTLYKSLNDVFCVCIMSKVFLPAVLTNHTFLHFYTNKTSKTELASNIFLNK